MLKPDSNDSDDFISKHLIDLVENTCIIRNNFINIEESYILNILNIINYWIVPPKDLRKDNRSILEKELGITLDWKWFDYNNLTKIYMCFFIVQNSHYC